MPVATASIRPSLAPRMSPFARLSLRFWFVAPLLALGFLLWVDAARVRRVEFVSALPNGTLRADPTSPTGYAGGQRTLIAPGHNNESYQSILQTQQMVATGQWRLRHADYDNAPIGRPILSASPYRWWLAFVGWCNHVVTGQPIGPAVERGALWADPILHLLFLAAAAVFVWRRFGALPALRFSVGTALWFPLAGGFVPGAPDARNLTHIVLFASVLTLATGILSVETAPGRARRWFAAAGAMGGVALWLNVSADVVLFSIGLGGVAAAWLTRRKLKIVLPWRAWAVAGASAAFAGYLVEYAPAHLDLKALRLTDVHPLYALAWLGLGEWLMYAQTWIRGQKPGRRGQAVLAGAAIALLGVPAVMWLRHDPGFLRPDTFATRLTLLDETPGADNFAKWLVQEGLSFRLLATCLPLAALGPGLWLLGRRDTTTPRRIAVAVILVAAVVVFGFGCTELSWWSTLHFLLLALLVVASSGASAGAESRVGRWLAAAAIAALPAVIALVPAKLDPSKPALTRTELQGLAERDFAQWLARRRGDEGAIVLAPPNLTVSLIYHGGLHGLGSPFRENEEGFRASVRLAGAVHADEAQALARQRGVTHIAIPSWDGFLDEYAQLGGGELDHTFMGLLHSWLPPRWLRPVPYYLPKLGDFANEQLFVFEQTDIQDNATSLSRLAEYFVDMGQTDLAAQVAQALAHEYAGDLGAQVAKARTELVRDDRAGLAKSIDAITAALKDHADDALPWDRRVSLCLVLAGANRIPAAKDQATRCLEEMGEADLRGLSEATLFRFLTLCKALELNVDDPQLHDLARSLLPAPLREQL
jgi:hypothetical protein